METQNITVKIVQDSDINNPLVENEIMDVYYVSNRYTLGNIRVSNLVEKLMELLEYGEAYQNRLYNQYGDTKELFNVLIANANKKGFYATPIYGYIHSGVVVSTSPFDCRFDSGLSGFAIINKKQAKEVYGTKASQLAKHVEAELKTFNLWLSGEIYGFQVEDEDGNTLDSCYGFYNYDSMIEDMCSHINHDEYGYSKEEFISLLNEAKENI